MVHRLKYYINNKNHLIVSGRNILGKELSLFRKKNPDKNYLIVCDNSLKGNANLLEISGISCSDPIYIKHDSKKDINTVLKVLRGFKKLNVSRKTVIICIGGGTLGDICGFACSIYMRGIEYIQIGTTLMSQLDCIIQKVAVCDSSYKNIYGSFYSPVLTINDVSFLESRTPELIASVEVIKHYLVTCKKFSRYTELVQLLLKTSIRGLAKIIHDSARIKAGFVCSDIHDQNGRQKALSLGHTFANVIETLHPKVSHAEAVWIGIGLCLTLSEKMFDLDPRVLESFLSCRNKLCPSLPVVTIDKKNALRLFKGDKISRNGQIGLVLLKSLGNHTVVHDVSYSMIEDVFLKDKYVRYIKN